MRLVKRQAFSGGLKMAFIKAGYPGVSILDSCDKHLIEWILLKERVSCKVVGCAMSIALSTGLVVLLIPFKVHHHQN